MQPVAVSDLHGRVVVTAHGTKLGSIKDVVIDADSGRVVNFVVKHGILGGNDLLIGPEEVVEIRADAVVVKDASVSFGNRVPA